MPYLIEKYDGDAARKVAAESAPFGPGFAPGVVAQVARVELWGSSFTDPGADWCEHRAFDAQGARIGARRRAGY